MNEAISKSGARGMFIQNLNAFILSFFGKKLRGKVYSSQPAAGTTVLFRFLVSDVLNFQAMKFSILRTVIYH